MNQLILPYLLIMMFYIFILFVGADLQLVQVQAGTSTSNANANTNGNGNSPTSSSNANNNENNPGSPSNPTNNNGYCPAKSPNFRSCGGPAAVADLICALYVPSQAFSYGIFYFEEGIAPLCRINYKCEFGRFAVLEAVDIHGYFIELTFPTEKGTVTNLWYIDVTQSCPQITIVLNSQNNPTGFNVAIPNTPIDRDFAYLTFTQLQQAYNAPCGNLPSAGKNDCPLTCSPNQQSYYSSSYPQQQVSVSLAGLKSVQVYSPSNQTRSPGQVAADFNGLPISCKATGGIPGSDPFLYQVTCIEKGYENFPYCRNRSDLLQISQVLKDDGYDQYLECLDRYKTCAISTLWAEYNSYGKRDTNLVPIKVAIYADQAAIAGNDYRNIAGYTAFLLVSGYGESQTKQDLMRPFFELCAF